MSRRWMMCIVVLLVFCGSSQPGLAESDVVLTASFGDTPEEFTNHWQGGLGFCVSDQNLYIYQNENDEINSHLVDEFTQLIKIFVTIIKNAKP